MTMFLKKRRRYLMSLSPNNFVRIWMPFLGDLNLFNGEKNPARNLLSIAVLLFFWSLHFTGSTRSKRDKIKSNFVRLWIIYMYSAKCHRDINSFFISWVPYKRFTSDVSSVSTEGIVGYVWCMYWMVVFCYWSAIGGSVVTWKTLIVIFWKCGVPF